MQNAPSVPVLSKTARNRRFVKVVLRHIMVTAGDMQEAVQYLDAGKH